MSASVGLVEPSRLAAAWARLREAWSRWPWWLRLVVAVLLARAFTAVVLAALTAHPGGYLAQMTRWDGVWYRQIAEHGYVGTGSESNATVGVGQWAFYPAFPLLARLVMAGTGLSFAITVAVLNPLLATAASVLLYAVLARFLPPPVATWAVVLWSAYPAAPVLQLGYTEALAMVAVLAVLLCLSHDRYLWAAPAAVLLAFTRPLAVPLLAVVAGHALLRWRRRGRDPLPPAQWTRLWVLLATCVVGVAAWPGIAWLVTGRRDAYLSSMAAWRDDGRVRWFRPWWEALNGSWSAALVLLILAALLLAPVLTVRRGLSPDLAMWQVAMVGYLVAVQDPSTSLIRYVLPMFATFVAPAVSRYRVLPAGVLLASLMLQVVWVTQVWDGARNGVGLPP